MYLAIELSMRCLRCESKLKPNTLTCIECGNKLDETEYERLREFETKSKKLKFKIIGIALTVLIAGTGTLVANSLVTKHELQIEAEKQLKLQRELIIEQEKERIREQKDYSWVPEGYTKFSNNYNLAYKSISYDAADCYSNCWGFIVFSKNSCNSLRIEANITRNGTILDSSSDIASNVPAYGKVIMKIVSSADLPWQASVTDAICT